RWLLLLTRLWGCLTLETPKAVNPRLLRSRVRNFRTASASTGCGPFGSPLRYCFPPSVRHPDVCAIERNPRGAGSYRVGSQHNAIADSHLGDAVTHLVRDPDIIAVEGNASGALAYGDHL